MLVSSMRWAGWPELAAHPWAYPALEVVHLVGVALLLGNLVLLELRVWGLAPTLPIAPLARLALGLVLTGAALSIGSGLVMFGTRPAELLANGPFVWKLGLLMLAATNAAMFHARGGLQRQDGVARLQTALSLGTWVGAIIAGRWIAYA